MSTHLDIPVYVRCKCTSVQIFKFNPIFSVALQEKRKETVKMVIMHPGDYSVSVGSLKKKGK